MIKHIVVTQEDISRGVPEDGENCPVARAIRREFPSNIIAVTYEYAKIGSLKAYFPDWVNGFITAYDQPENSNDELDSFSPFEFDLDIPLAF